MKAAERRPFTVAAVAAPPTAGAWAHSVAAAWVATPRPALTVCMVVREWECEQIARAIGGGRPARFCRSLTDGASLAQVTLAVSTVAGISNGDGQGGWVAALALCALCPHCATDVRAH